MISADRVKAAMLGIAENFLGMRVDPTDKIDFTIQGVVVLEVLFLMLEAEFGVDIERSKMAELLTNQYTVEGASARFADLIQSSSRQFPIWKRSLLADCLREPELWRY